MTVHPSDLADTLEQTSDYEFEQAVVEDDDTLRLVNVTSDTNLNDLAKFVSVRGGFNVYPEGDDNQTLTKPDDFPHTFILKK